MQAPDELRLSVRAIGLNFADVFATLGIYPAAGRPPFTPGFEACGIVDAVGANVTQFKPGDRVCALTKFGAYTALLNVRATRTRHLPDDWSFADGAAFYAQALTAWYALFVLGGLPVSRDAHSRFITSPHRAVLIHSAAGGVGLRLVEIVRKIGGLAVCTVGSESKVAVLTERGVPRERIIVRGVDDAKHGFLKTVREKCLGGTGARGLDVVVDSVLGDYFEPGYRALNAGGRYIVMGSASIIPQGAIAGGLVALWNFVGVMLGFYRRPRVDVVKLMDQNKTVAGFNVGRLFEENQLFDDFFGELDQLELQKATIGKTFAFEEAPEALKYFQTGKSVGKLVLTIGQQQSRL